jgi:hypothetical protein
MGKSFEIRPTGVAHAELLLPVEFAPSYPKASSPFDGKVREHYSWKKVTTNVSGFILGSPTIDHYGDMVVRLELPLPCVLRSSCARRSQSSHEGCSRWRRMGTPGSVWTPSRLEDGSMEYSAERERVWQMGNQPWPDVSPIFIDEPDFMC